MKPLCRARSTPVEALQQEVAALPGQHVRDGWRLLGRCNVEQRRHLPMPQLVIHNAKKSTHLTAVYMSP